MLRRFQIGALRNHRVFAEKSTLYKFILGGSVLAVYSLPMSKCDGKSETSNGSKSGSGSNSNSDKGGSDPVTDAIMKFIDQYTPTLQKVITI